MNKRYPLILLLGMAVPAMATLDLRTSASDQLETVKEKSLEYVPGLVDSLPLAKGYKSILEDVLSDQVSTAIDGLDVKLTVKIAELEDHVQAILAEEMTLIPKDIGQDFFASYVGFSGGRSTGPWDHDPIREAYLRGNVIGGFLGFGRFFSSNLYLGSETFGNYTTNDFYPDKTYRYKSNWDAGFAVLPGYQLYHGFAYLRTGVGLGRVSRTTETNDGFDFNEMKAGVHFGLGYNFYVTTRWHMRVDYSSMHFAEVTVQDPNDTTIKKHFKPSVSHYTLGGVYYLDSLNLDKVDAPPFRSNTFYGGFYMDIPNHFRDNSKTLVPGVAVAEEEKSALDGFLGGVTLGYLYQFDDTPWVVGVEGYGTVTSRDFEETNDHTAKWKNTFGTGGAILAGYMIKGSNMLYGRVGAGAGTFEKKGDKTVTMNKTAASYGFGAETMLTKRFAFRVEYSHDSYADLTPADEHFTFAIDFYY